MALGLYLASTRSYYCHLLLKATNYTVAQGNTLQSQHQELLVTGLKPGVLISWFLAL